MVTSLRRKSERMWRRRYLALAFAGFGVAWLLVNKQFSEGPMIWHVAHEHALMLTDLIAVAAWAVALLLWRPRKSR